MDGTIIYDTNRKEASRSEIGAVSELTWGNGLMNAMVARQRFLEQGMTTEADMFGKTIQEYRTKFLQAGLDPDEIIKERARLLTEALQKKT
jgi:hypothetical protein